MLKSIKTMSKRTNIFVTRADLEPALKSIESKHRLKYFPLGIFESARVEPVYSALQIKDLGVSLKGDQVHEKAYLVMHVENKLNVREVKLKKGGMRYAVDQLINPATIVFQPGGLFEDHCLICGRVDTVSTIPESIELYNLFVREITEGFKKIKSYYLGPEAFRYLEKGMRLTQNIRRSAEFDLTR